MSRRAVGVRLAVCAAVIGGCVWVARDLSADEVRTALAGVSMWPMLAAVAINFAILGLKAVSWWCLLPPTERVGVGLLYRSTLLAYAGSVVFPLRAGELARLWMLRDAGVRLGTGAAVAIGEKLLDIVAMLAWVAPLPLLVANLPRSTTLWISGLAVGSIVALIALRPILAKLGEDGWRGDLARGLAALREPRRVGPALAVLLVAWGLELALVMVVLAAVHLELPIGAGLVVVLAINVAIALPSTPAQLGTLELGALAGLDVVGVGHAPALAFALTYHLLQVVPVVAIGLLVGGREIWRRREP